MSEEKLSPWPELQAADGVYVRGERGELISVPVVLIEDAPAMLKLLRRIERDGDSDGGCVVCGRPLRMGSHAPECALDVLLDKHGRSP
jgi:hypothetical protein